MCVGEREIDTNREREREKEEDSVRVCVREREREREEKERWRRVFSSLNGFRPTVTIACLTKEESECERERQT